MSFNRKGCWLININIYEFGNSCVFVWDSAFLTQDGTAEGRNVLPLWRLDDWRTLKEWSWTKGEEGKKVFSAFHQVKKRRLTKEKELFPETGWYQISFSNIWVLRGPNMTQTLGLVTIKVGAEWTIFQTINHGIKVLTDIKYRQTFHTRYFMWTKSSLIISKQSQ